jgi:hypothetical protein
MTIKEELSGNLIYHCDLRTGTIKNQVTGVSGTFVSTPYFKNTPSGKMIQFDGVSDIVNVGTSPFYTDSSTSLTVVAIVDIDPKDFDGVFKAILDTSGGNPNTNQGFYLALDDRGAGNPTEGITFNFDTSVSNNVYYNQSNLFPKKGKYHIIGTFDGGTEIGAVYVNGLDVSAPKAGSGVGNFNPRNANLYIGAINTPGSYLKGGVQEILLMNTSITAAQASQLYIESQKEANLTHVPLKTKLPQSLTYPEFEQDLIWAKGTGWTIANGKASSDGSQVADSLLTQARAIANLPYTVEFQISNYSAGNVAARVGATSGTNRAANGIYKERIAGGANVSLGLVADLDFIGDIEYCKAYQGTPIDFYQTGQDWNVSTANVTTGFIENTGWHTIDASTFQVVDTDTDNKGITSISTDQSSAYIPSTQAYGQWEFDMNPAAASVIRVPIMSTSNLRIAGGGSSTNGYYVAVSVGALYLLRSTAGAGTIISQSANGTLTTGVWYRIKVTRTFAGVFTTYYSSDGGLNYTQMSTVAGSNPVTDTTHTTSAYTCIEPATDFIIRNFRYSPVID